MSDIARGDVHDIGGIALQSDGPGVLLGVVGLQLRKTQETAD